MQNFTAYKDQHGLLQALAKSEKLKLNSWLAEGRAVMCRHHGAVIKECIKTWLNILMALNFSYHVNIFGKEMLYKYWKDPALGNSSSHSLLCLHSSVKCYKFGNNAGVHLAGGIFDSWLGAYWFYPQSTYCQFLRRCCCLR